MRMLDGYRNQLFLFRTLYAKKQLTTDKEFEEKQEYIISLYKQLVQSRFFEKRHIKASFEALLMSMSKTRQVYLDKHLEYHKQKKIRSADARKQKIK